MNSTFYIHPNSAVWRKYQGRIRTHSSITDTIGKAQADEAFENIHIGMPMEQVISILGEAGVDIGSGTVIHKYTAASGTAYTISYICSVDDYYVNKIKIG